MFKYFWIVCIGAVVLMCALLWFTYVVYTFRSSYEKHGSIPKAISAMIKEGDEIIFGPLLFGLAVGFVISVFQFIVSIE